MNGITFFLKTFHRDLNSAVDCLTSLSRFCLSRYEVIVAVDTEEEKLHLKFLLKNLDIECRFLLPSDFGIAIRYGYVDQQCFKMQSCKFANFDLIFFLDSDMVFWKNFGIEHFKWFDKPIIPFREWGRQRFLSNEEISRLQEFLDKPNLFFVGDLVKELEKLAPSELSLLGYKRFATSSDFSILERVDGVRYTWTPSTPDIMWIASSRMLCPAPVDTMCSHFAVYTSTLADFNSLVDKRFGGIWSLAYDRKKLPVFSEFQLLGNYIVEAALGREESEYSIIRADVMNAVTELRSKIPVVKFNGIRSDKSEVTAIYARMLQGEYAHINARMDILKDLPQGWH